jgi:DNA-binding protein H-NS
MNRKKTTASNYRKPPVEHQFQKGRSGNPKGRPKKKAVQPGGGLGGGIADRLAAMALDEAIRPVTVREGDKVSKIPAMQALIRTMFRAAAEGDTKAARELIGLIGRAETERSSEALEILKGVAQYKEKFGPIFEQHERAGLPPPDIFPHPDDVIINKATGGSPSTGRQPRKKLAH